MRACGRLVLVAQHDDGVADEAREAASSVRSALSSPFTSCAAPGA